MLSNRVFAANTVEELAELPMHDQWLETDGIRLSEDGVLTLPMRIGQGAFDDEWAPEAAPTGLRRFIVYSYKEPRFKAALAIENVVSYTLKDDAEIAGGSVHDITCESGVLTVKCCEPVVVVAEVSALSIRLTISDVIADATITTVLPGGVQVTRTAKESD